MTVNCEGRVIAEHVKIADSLIGRFFGLMGREELEMGEGLLLKNCSSIHSFFMKMSIDAVYLSKDFKVLGVETLKPWRIGAFYRYTAHVLELCAGTAGVSEGEKLDIQG
jgi:uncharacterized membrane protein (UPF0127 family)